MGINDVLRIRADTMKDRPNARAVLGLIECSGRIRLDFDPGQALGTGISV